MAGNMMEFAVNMSMLMSGNVTQNSAKAVQALSGLQEKLQGLSKTGRLMQSFQTQQSKVQALGQKLVAAREKVRAMREEIRRSDAPAAAMQKRYAQAQKEAGLLGEQFQAQRKKLADLNSELIKSGVNTSRLIQEQNKLASQTDKVKAAQDRLINAQEKYNSLRAQLLNWGNIKGDVLSSMAVINTFKKPIAVDMNFEQAMANVRSVSNPTPEEFTLLRNQAIMLGSTTQFTATQAANAQETLMRAGLSVKETMQTMSPLLSMSAAEGMPIDQAADIIVNTIGGLRLPAEFAGILTDLFAYTSANSNTNIAKLGEAMKAAASEAAAVKMPAESVFAILAAMTSSARGSEAGTALASSMARLYAPTKEMSGVYDRLGILTRTRTGDVVRLDKLLTEIAGKTKNLGTQQQQEVYETLFGKNHMAKMIDLTANIQEGQYEKIYAGLISERDGASALMARTRNDTLQGDITSLGSAWEGLMIRVGNALDPVNRFAVQGLTNIISQVNTIIDRHKSWVSAGVRIAYIAGGFMVLKKVAHYALLIKKTFGAWLELKTASAALGGMTAKAGLLTGIFGSVKAALAGLGAAVMAHPLVALGSIIAAGIAYAWTKSEAFKKWWESWTFPDVCAGLYESFNNACDWVRQKWQEITDWIASLNPFNWTAPTAETLQRQEAQMRNSPQGQNAQAIADRLARQYAPKAQNAKGGIYSRPIWTWAAENGAEAIIPLTDKARGIPLLNQAMNILGVAPAMTPTIPAIIPQSTNINSDSFSPTVNLTVSVSGNEDPSLTDRIKQAVFDALDEISAYRERVAYA